MEIVPIFLRLLASLVVPQLLAKERQALYKDAQVWRTPLQSTIGIDLFDNLRQNGEISLWKLTQSHIDYLVHGNHRSSVHEELVKHNLTQIVLIPNVERSIARSQAHTTSWTNSSLRQGHRLNFISFHKLPIIEEYLDYIKNSYSSIATVQTIGKSVERRPIRMVRISNGNPANKAMVINGGQHAREWAAISSVLYVLNHIVTKFKELPKHMTDKDWYIIPLLNPDGYVFSTDKDRLWRKNRRQNSNSRCPGVDLNRNFPLKWNLPGVTDHDECLEGYAGKGPLSEPEAKALTSVLSIVNKTPSSFVDVHTYGQYIFHPWGYGGHSPHKAKLEKAAAVMKKEIYRKTLRNYQSGTPETYLYRVSGAAFDWFQSEGVPYAYAVEGRDQGSAGFALPPDQIVDCAEELLTIVKVLSRTINGTKT